MKVPFRNLLVFPNQAPWPGRFRDSNPCKPSDAGRARELQKSAQPATQMLSVNCLYQRNVVLCNIKFTEVTSLRFWFAPFAFRGYRARHFRERKILLFRPLWGLCSTSCSHPHGLRRGLHSFAPSELELVGTRNRGLPILDRQSSHRDRCHSF